MSLMIYYLKAVLRRLLTLLPLLLLTAAAAKAQQLFSYTQYMNNLTPLNPAYSVIDPAGSVSAILRKQWTGISGSPSTFIFNGSLPIESLGAAGGMTVLHDQFAVEHLTEVNFFFAKRVELAEDVNLAVSLNGGLRNYVAAYSTLDANDPLFRYDVRETRPNIGFGILLFGNRYYFGAAVPEFTTRSLGTASATGNNYFSSHYNFSAAYVFDLNNEDISVKPATLVTYSRTEPLIADMSATVYLKRTLGIGANYRTNGEAAGILSYVSDQFSLGYAYQFGTTSSNIAQGFRNNTHEVTISYRFGAHPGERSLL